MIQFEISMRLFGVVLILCTVVSLGQEKPALVKVHGQATVSVVPDQAQFDIGVVSQASSAKAAADQNATQSDTLVKQLTTTFPSAVINTVNYSVNPNYRYPQNSAPVISGYTANNTVRILLNDLSRVQTVMDIAIKAGANSINRLQFSLQNESAARAKALRDVAENATLTNQEFNRAFVLMQYFGYLRRDPNNGNGDTDYTGYDFWLTKLNQAPGDQDHAFANADMVESFIVSSEYRGRF